MFGEVERYVGVSHIEGILKTPGFPTHPFRKFPFYPMHLHRVDLWPDYCTMAIDLFAVLQGRMHGLFFGQFHKFNTTVHLCGEPSLLVACIFNTKGRGQDCFELYGDLSFDGSSGNVLY
jgi:hypothetical protein